jgi:hypothetical protein
MVLNVRYDTPHKEEQTWRMGISFEGLHGALLGKYGVMQNT